jgi:hypothetical protein
MITVLVEDVVSGLLFRRIPAEFHKMAFNT